MGAYLYSPAFAQLIRPLTILPWPIFVTIWTAFNLAIVWWLLGRWSLPAMLFLPIPFEIVSGNVHLMYAAAIVLGFRASFTWALPILTKVTPGIGLAWFAVRREWRQLGLALGVTGADRRGLVRARSRAVAPVVRHHRRELEHADDRRLVPPRRAPRPPPDRHRGRRRRRAHRPGMAAAGRRHARAARAVAELAGDPRRVRAAVAGARRPRRRGAGIRDRRARGRALVTASVSATGELGPRPVPARLGALGRALEHPAVMPGIAVAGAVFVVAMVSFALRGDPLIGYDAHAYYQAAALDDPYRATINGGFDAVGGLYEYKYPPPLAQVLHPVRMLGISWPVVPRRVDGAAPRVAGLHGTALDAPAPAVPARARRAVARQPQHPAWARDRARDALARRPGRSSC